jgi:hypothetical protein
MILTDGERMNECLNIIGWSKATLARRLGIGVRICFRWGSDHNEVPPEVMVWLVTLAGAHLDNQLPKRWMKGQSPCKSM